MKIKTTGLSGYSPTVHDSQHDGRYPWHFTGGGIKYTFNFFEEHSNRFGKRIREADGNESSNYHCPPPASIWGVYPTGPPTAGGIVNVDKFQNAVQIQVSTQYKI